MASNELFEGERATKEKEASIRMDCAQFRILWSHSPQ
jgi:hypothetical protein